MRVLYYLGKDWCEKDCDECHVVKAHALRLRERYPDRVVLVNVEWYMGDLERIDSRQTIERVPCCVVEEDGEEAGRVIGLVSYEELAEMLLGNVER